MLGGEIPILSLRNKRKSRQKRNRNRNEGPGPDPGHDQALIAKGRKVSKGEAPGRPGRAWLFVVGQFGVLSSSSKVVSITVFLENIA